MARCRVQNGVTVTKRCECAASVMRCAVIEIHYTTIDAFSHEMLCVDFQCVASNTL